MGPLLVRGRNGGKQLHLRSACQKPGRTVATCTSAAAKLIRKLQEQLKAVKPSAKSQKQHGSARAEHGAHRAVQRDAILNVRRLLGCSQASWQELAPWMLCKRAPAPKRRKTAKQAAPAGPKQQAEGNYKLNPRKRIHAPAGARDSYKGKCKAEAAGRG